MLFFLLILSRFYPLHIPYQEKIGACAQQPQHRHKYQCRREVTAAGQETYYNGHNDARQLPNKIKYTAGKIDEMFGRQRGYKDPGDGSKAYPKK